MPTNLVKRIASRIDPRQLSTKTRLLVIFLVFASCLIINGAIFLHSPWSGRLRTFVCKPDAAQHNICTVTIYGFRQIYRRSFPAEDFVSAHITMACGGSAVWGIDIRTKHELIEFIPAIEDSRYIHPLAKAINDQFIDGQPTPTLSYTYNGISFLLYLGGILLILGVLLLGLCISLFVRRKKPGATGGGSGPAIPGF
jgi:hypothetical protein